MGDYGALRGLIREGMASMTDGDPFGRRSGRRPDDRNYSQPWNDEGALEDPYTDPAPPDTRRARQQPRSDQPQYDPQQPYPYRPQDQRYPDEQSRQSWNPPPDQQGWPDRPYANPPRQRVSQDPYRQQSPYDYDPQDAGEVVDDWAEEGAPQRRRASVPRAQRPSLPKPSVPPALAAAFANQDPRLLVTAAGSILSLAVMAVITMTRIDSLPGWFPLHLDASGVATRWGTDSTLWRLPFGLAMITLMNIATAVVLGMREQRFAWILIGSLPLIHVIAWIALILIGW